MSTITTILGSDQPVNSRTVINTNFANLNTDKQEISGKDATGGYAGLTLFKINFKNAANTFTNFFTNATTAARTYTFPDKDITVAGIVDITGVNSGTNTGDETTARINALYGTINAITVGSVEVGHATDTTITRVLSGTIAVDGITISSTLYPTSDTDGATITFNLASNNKHQVTIAANRTLSLSNTTNVPVFAINIKQDATGSRTVTWFSGITWAGGTVPTLTTTANKTDSFGFQQISAGVYLGCVIFQNA